jgi:hypothetical protein
MIYHPFHGLENFIAIFPMAYTIGYLLTPASRAENKDQSPKIKTLRKICGHNFE